MIYVVKCYSCEQEFQVKRGETGADMICPECGTANNIRDVVERIEDEPGKVDPDMQAIKGFDMDEHPVSDAVGWRDEEKRRQELRIELVFLIIFLILFLLHKLGVIDGEALMEKISGLFEIRN